MGKIKHKATVLKIWKKENLRHNLYNTPSNHINNHDSHFWSASNIKPITPQRETITHFFSYTAGTWYHWRSLFKGINTYYTRGNTSDFRSVRFDPRLINRCPPPKAWPRVNFDTSDVSQPTKSTKCLCVIVRKHVTASTIYAGFLAVGFCGLVVRYTPTLWEYVSMSE